MNHILMMRCTKRVCDQYEPLARFMVGLPGSDGFILEAHDHVTVSGQSELEGFWDGFCVIRHCTLRKWPYKGVRQIWHSYNVTDVSNTCSECTETQRYLKNVTHTLVRMTMKPFISLQLPKTYVMKLFSFLFSSACTKITKIEIKTIQTLKMTKTQN